MSLTRSNVSYLIKINLLFIIFGASGLSKPFSERIVINLELSDLLVLIGRHRYELRLLEDVGPEGGVGQLEDIAGSHQVEPRLVLVH